MLLLSGVIRPSYVKLRYMISLLNSEEQYRTSQIEPVITVRASNLLQKFFDLMSWPTEDERSLGHYSSSNTHLLRFPKRPSTSTR